MAAQAQRHADDHFAEAGGFLRSRADEPTPDLQLHFVIAKLVDHGRKTTFGHGYSCHVCLLRPRSRGSVRLAAADPFAAPLIDPDFLGDPDDLERLVAGFKAMRALLAQPALASLGGREAPTSAAAGTDAEIEQFIRRDDGGDGTIRFVKQAYYVEPDKIGQKAFSLLRAVLADKGLTAICKVVIKDREALAALDPFADTMVLSTLHWPDEIRAVADLDLPTEEFEFKPAERLMAEQLIEAMTAEFDPAQYRDEYREALMGVIEAKVEGRQVVQAAEEPAGALIDLMAALEASVNAARASRAEPTTVAQARERSDSRSKATAEPAPAAAPGEAAEETTEETRPVRRRKTA